MKNFKKNPLSGFFIISTLFIFACLSISSGQANAFFIWNEGETAITPTVQADEDSMDTEEDVSTETDGERDQITDYDNFFTDDGGIVSNTAEPEMSTDPVYYDENGDPLPPDESIYNYTEGSTEQAMQDVEYQLNDDGSTSEPDMSTERVYYDENGDPLPPDGSTYNYTDTTDTGTLPEEPAEVHTETGPADEEIPADVQSLLESTDLMFQESEALSMSVEMQLLDIDMPYTDGFAEDEAAGYLDKERSIMFLEDRLERIEVQLSGLQKSKDSINGKITTINEGIAALEAKITAIENDPQMGDAAKERAISPLRGNLKTLREVSLPKFSQQLEEIDLAIQKKKEERDRVQAELDALNDNVA